MAISISATKAGPCCGKPAVEIAYDPGTTLDQILEAQKQVFGDKRLAKAIGFKFCGGCYSGLDLNIKQKFEQIVQPG
ncbi:MAG TPA: hypothetical protein DHV85_11535 [Candidatus Accumulibacter sp.]|nr:hypothetical protein [Accumulibacter sp.]